MDMGELIELIENLAVDYGFDLSTVSALDLINLVKELADHQMAYDGASEFAIDWLINNALKGE